MLLNLTITSGRMSLFLVLLFAFLSRFPVSTSNLNTLQLVQVLFRHGDRNQIYSYPNEPKGQGPSGQLTNVGKIQEYDLGRYLRRRYDGFLPTEYEPNTISMLVSDLDRTIMSAEMVLAGLCPPIRMEDNWNPRIEWTPVPFRTIPKVEDKMLRMTKKCPKYGQLVSEVLKSDYIQRLNKENEDLIKYVNENAGINATSVSDVVFMGDVLKVEESHHLKLPTWAQNVLAKLQTLSALISKAKTSTIALKRLRGGPLLSAFLDNMKSSYGKSEKMFLFSAHDSTLMRLMGTIDIFDPIVPPYSAALIVELHRDRSGDNDSDSYVKIFYRNETNREPYELRVPGCDTPCYLSKLLEITEPVIPTNWEWEAECYGSRILPPFEFAEHYSPFLPVILAVGTLMAAVMVLVCAMSKNSQPTLFSRLKFETPGGYEQI